MNKDEAIAAQEAQAAELRTMIATELVSRVVTFDDLSWSGENVSITPNQSLMIKGARVWADAIIAELNKSS